MTTIPLQSVNFRTDAVPARGMVTVLDESAIKVNAKEDPAGQGSGLDLETMLTVRARIHNAGTVNSSWVDLHVFDAADELIRSETLPLRYVRGGDEGDEYGFEGSVYRGTGASPGSVWLAPDARKVQYRLYCEADGTVFSDGLLRQHDVAADSVTTNPGAPAPKAGRRKTAAR